MGFTGKSLAIFGCGYVGTALAQAATSAGIRVTALTRNTEKAEELRKSGNAVVVVADLAGEEWHRLIPPDSDYAVNCVSAGGGGLAGYGHSYVDGMRSLLKWAGSGARPPGTIVYTSSTSVYPQGGGARVDEDASTAGIHERGRVLLEAENLLRQSPDVTGRRWFILRLAGIYGPGRHTLLDQLRDGVPSLGGDPGTRLNLVHRDDIVSAILLCLAAPAPVRNRVLNVADGQPAARGELTRWLCDRLGRSLPAFDGRASGVRRAEGESPDRIIVSDRLRQELAWQPGHPDFRSGYSALLPQV